MLAKYNIVLFTERNHAEHHKRQRGSAYGRVREVRLYARPVTLWEVRGY
jgi:hypothetical protein